VIDAPVAFQAITDAGFRYEQLRLAWVGSWRSFRTSVRKYCTLPGEDLPQVSLLSCLWVITDPRCEATGSS
jgi:hypothetical protein